MEQRNYDIRYRRSPAATGGILIEKRQYAPVTEICILHKNTDLKLCKCTVLIEETKRILTKYTKDDNMNT